MKANSDVLDLNAELRKEIKSHATRKGISKINNLLWLNEVSAQEKDAELVEAMCDEQHTNVIDYYIRPRGA